MAKGDNQTIHIKNVDIECSTHDAFKGEKNQLYLRKITKQYLGYDRQPTISKENNQAISRLPQTTNYI